MPVYDIELSDGRTVTLEGDKEPSESDVMSALGHPSQPAQLPPGQRPYPEDASIEADPSSFEPQMSGKEAFKSLLPLPDPIKGESLLGKLAAAPANFAIQTAGGIASPGGALAAPLGLLGRVGAVAGGLGFGVPAVTGGLKRVYQGAAMGDLQEALEGALQTGTGGLITMGGVKGLLPKAAPPEPIPSIVKEGPLNDQIQSTDRVPAEQQGIPTDQPPEGQVEAGTAQRSSEGEPPLPPNTEAKEEVAGDLEKIHNRDIARLAQINEELNQLKAQRPKPTTKSEAWLEGDPFLEGQTKWDADLESKVGRLEHEAAGLQEMLKADKPTPQPTTPPEEAATPAAEPKGIAASVRNKWTSATEEPFGSEGGFVSLDPLKDLVEKATPYVKSAARFVKDIGSEESQLSKLGDYGKSVLQWSGKLQKSFAEAGAAQKEIGEKVPDPARQEGITNWIQADGDPKVLADRLTATTDPKLRKGYEAALSLTPEEIEVANDVRKAYDALGKRGKLYDVLQNFKQNYVTQVWDLGKGQGFGGARNLRDKFRFNKASTFPTFFDGEQAGYTPKTKEIGKLLPVYLHEMNFVIANRQLAEALTKGVASDGLPLAEKLGKETPTIDDSNYKSLPNQPALAGWKFHPEAFNRLSNVLGKSAIREWYSRRTSALAEIPKAIVRGLDFANSETKRTMLGLLAPFHQVQEGTHGVGHRVNPLFNIPKIDLVGNPAQMDAASHGLMLLPDRASAEQFMEGYRTSGLVSKIPKIGPLADHYSNYLFHEYIPGLKFKTYEAILERNQGVYSKELASGKVDIADVKHLSAEQANAAYGHLNYADLARNPTIQHIMQLGLLAPDFLEARARFAGQSIKGITGAKVGREQILALATLAIAQAATSYTSAKLTGGEWDSKRPFEFHVGNRRYTMRSVPEDVSSVLHDARSFAYSRISPLIGKGLLQYFTGTDHRGQKISVGETTKELLQQPIPISARGFLGLGRQSLSGWEQLASAVGLRISRYSPSSDVFDMAHQWMGNNPDPKVQKRLQEQQHSVFPESEYKTLRNSLADNNLSSAREAYQELLKTKTPLQVYKALSHPHPFTGKSSDEIQFVKSLNDQQRRIYDQAIQERKDSLKRFVAIKGQR